MKSIVCLILGLSLVAGARAAAPPGDEAEGKRLHDASCLGCHDTGVYLRKDRKMRSLDELRQQLGGCAHMAGEEFSPAQTQSIVKYLNERFYRFRW